MPASSRCGPRRTVSRISGRSRSRRWGEGGAMIRVGRYLAHALLVLGLVVLIRAGARAEASLSLETTIKLDDVSGRIDHMAFDRARGRLLVAALGDNSLEMVDIRAGKRIGRFAGLKEPQGVAWSDKGEMVLRCLGWVETSSSGQFQVELAGEEVDDGLEVAAGSVTASLCLGGLHETVDSLDQSVGDFAVEPAQGAIPVMLDGAGGINHRRQTAVGGPEVPGLQGARSGFGRGLVVEVLKGQPDLIGACGLEMPRGQRVKRRLLSIRQVGRIAQPYIACAA